MMSFGMTFIILQKALEGQHYMHGSNDKRFINIPHHRLCNMGRIKCKVTSQFGRNRERYGWSAMWMPRSMIVTISHLLRVVLETPVDNLFELKQNGSGQIWQFSRGRQ